MTMVFAIALALQAAHGPAARPAAAARAEILRAEPDDGLQSEASVVQIDALRRQGSLTAKLFGSAGGDPAMNGLYTYLAFFDSPQEGWRVFRLGDFLSYRILAEAPGRVTLEVDESVMNQRTGAIGSRVRRLAVSWTVRVRGTAPETVRVTAAAR
jgi:hypothetical protein